LKLPTSIHIIAFNVPYPANYGGVIDVFHKLRWLKKNNIAIHLHCFQYGRAAAPILETLCETVHYYKRSTHWTQQLNSKPYILQSRKHPELLPNLLKDEFPIIFEGLHSCYLLAHPGLKNRFKLYRESNIEHDYYRALANAEKNIFKKAYYFLESVKLKKWESILQHAQVLLSVSSEDSNYFQKRFATIPAVTLPSFHAYDSVTCKLGTGKYLLYHGNLSVQENEQAVMYLLQSIAKHIAYPIIIAGLQPSDQLILACKAHSNVQLIANTDEATMQALIEQAHLHFLVSFQKTGLKLKLLNALFAGRFCIVNEAMIHGAQLNDAVIIANDAVAQINAINDYKNRAFTLSDLAQRKQCLLTHHDNALKTQKLISLLQYSNTK
jgi:Glycosyl transferases group 1